MKLRVVRIAALVAAAHVAWSGVAVAQGIRHSDPELAQASRAIVTGIVRSVDSGRDPAVGYLYTYVTVDVGERIKGPVPESRIVIKQLGGRVGDLEMVVYDQAEFTVGEEVLLFLSVRPRDGTLQTTGLWQGKWTISRDPVGDGDLALRSELRRRDGGRLAGSNPGDDLRLLRPFLAELRSWSREAPARASGRSRPLTSLLPDASARRDSFTVVPPEAPAPGSGARTSLPLSSVSAAYTLLGSGSRWHEADDGTAVPVDIQAGGQPGLSGGGTSRIAIARALWNDVETPLVLARGNNARAQGFSSAQTCSDTYDIDNRLTIYFDDPCDEIADDGTLAIGGFFSTAADLRTVNGTTFRKIVKGYIINSDEPGVQTWLETPECFQDVQVHELGHTVGLGHTNAAGNIMRPTINSACLRGSTGSLGSDDVDGLRFIYADVAIKPDQPGSLTATAVGGDRIDLHWTDNSSNELQFKIRLQQPDGSWARIATVAANTTAFSHTGLREGERYCYKVQARNAAGNSPSSNVACAITGGSAPLAVTGLTATAFSSSRIDLSWLDTPDETVFKIKEQQPDGSWSRIALVGADQTTFSHTGLLPGTTHCYAVQARSPLGNAPRSNVACATTLAAGGGP